MSRLETDLDRIGQLAIAHRDDFQVMHYMLLHDDDLDDSRLDAQVEDVAAPIIDAVDCTQCANCCRSLDVYVTAKDVSHLARRLDSPIHEVISTLVDRKAAQKQGEWGRLCEKPCVFLKGNQCSIYTHRPEACRMYPVFTPDFRWILADTIEGASSCPIIYHVLIAMLHRVESGLLTEE